MKCPIHHIKKCMYMISIGPWKYVICQGIRVLWQTKKDLHRDDKLLRPNMDLWPDMRVICIVFAYVPSGLRSGHLL